MIPRNLDQTRIYYRKCWDYDPVKHRSKQWQQLSSTLKFQNVCQTNKLMSIYHKKDINTFTPSMVRTKTTLNHLQEIGMDNDISRQYRDDLVFFSPYFCCFNLKDRYFLCIHGATMCLCHLYYSLAGRCFDILLNFNFPVAWI